LLFHPVYIHFRVELTRNRDARFLVMKDKPKYYSSNNRMRCYPSGGDGGKANGSAQAKKSGMS